MSVQKEKGRVYFDERYISSEEMQGKEIYKRVRGSDPRAATCRGKLQYRRSKLNQEMNKEMMMRNGAEKLFKVTTNKKMQEMVALELSFVNSNLQLLKEQLAELNSSVQMYQDESAQQLVPMIPLGLKETKDINFMEPFKDFISEHYREDGNNYETSIQELMSIRQALKTPSRDQSGVQLLFEYYNLLYYVERRFFPPHRNLGIFFEWFDSLTGVPSTQKTIAFEKASILFNIASLYTQIGAKQNRTKSSGADAAVDSFLRAAGMFCYIRENFSNAPSMDLAPDTLETLTYLMLAQARECLFEKISFTPVEKMGIEICLDTAQEAAEVSEVYNHVHKVMSRPTVKNYVPYSWISLVCVKSEHYKALAHYYVAVGLLDHIGELSDSAKLGLAFLHRQDQKTTTTPFDINVPKNTNERRQLGKAHLREALYLHEEALRLHRMCRQLRQVDTLQNRLRVDHDAALNRYADIEEEDDFQEIIDPPDIQASTKYQLSLTPPDFSQYKVKDIFQELGPISIFSARHQWTAPRVLHIKKNSMSNYGFSVRGDAPVIVAGVDCNSPAEEAGMVEGDFIISTGDKDTRWSQHEEVVELIKNTGNELTVKVITPLNQSFLYPKTNSSSISPMSTTSHNCGISSGSSIYNTVRSVSSAKSKDSHKRLTWGNFFRRGGMKQQDSSIRSQQYSATRN
ncbi:rhophilin-2-B-like isoform X1 [Tachypleus tridentatus]|uniref:rhophilin-2-B-like isoform X1 n=2 Tax=Tachypleus tridentatus TaxID=6853 RepID=UPI003FD0AE3E